MSAVSNPRRQTPERAPQQARSIETRARILKSVEKLLEVDAYNTATVQDIVSAAGCSVGAFYGRFKDKDAALLTIFTARCDDLEGDARVVFHTKRGGLAHKLKKFIELVIDHTLRHKPIIRAGLVAPAANSMAPFIERAQEMNGFLIAEISALLTANTGDITHKHPDRAALYVAAIVGGLARDGLASSVRLTKRKGTLDGFVSEITAIVYGYLGIEKK